MKAKPTYEELEKRIKDLEGELVQSKKYDVDKFGLIDDIEFDKLFDIEEIQRIQDLFSEATGVASLITLPNGIPLTKPSNFCRLCSDIIRKTDKGLTNCYYSDAAIGRKNIEGATYQPCLSGGLWDGGASISVGGKHIANWLIGQVRNEDIDVNKVLSYAKEIGADEEEFKKALDEVTVMTTDKFKKIADILFYFANEISNQGFQNLQQQRLIVELQEKEIQLTKAKEKAEESDRLKTAFLQNMSHEIRTPMNAIMGFTHLLVEYHDNKPKLEHFSKIIKQRCNDLLEIINDILDISKIESGQLTLNEEACNIHGLFSELKLFFNEYQKRIGKEHIELHFQSPGELFFEQIQTDKVKLKQVLINLIGNAFKFTKAGVVEFGCQLHEGHLIFHVSDTGIGIAPDKHNEIFERFTQLRNSTTRNIGGTGLGLSIVKGLIDLLGGNIWLKSEQGKGTTFYFSINYVKSTTELKAPLMFDEEELFDFDNKTVLIVEDDLYNSEYLQEILSSRGFHAVTTMYGKEAIRIAAIDSIDLILMDIRLPDIHGYEATQMILKDHPQMKIIAQTAYAAHDERQKALEAGCIDYISKPIEQKRLLSLIHHHLKVG